MEETLEGGRGPPRAVAPLEREREMIYTGIFPTRLKFTEIKLLFKKGETANTSNYRPISMLTFSKIFEKNIFTRLIRHLNHNHILVDEQFGFRTKSSTD
jgi:hypothetical protein